MNKFIVFLCFIITLSLHLVVFLNYKNSQLIASKSQNTNPILLQLSKSVEIQKNIQKVENIQTSENIAVPKITKTPEIIKKKEIIKEKSLEKSPKEEIKEKTEDIKTSPRKSIEKTQELKPMEKTSKEKNIYTEEENKKIQQYLDSYASNLREEINKNKNYPTISKRLKEEGSVIISFRVLNTGLFTIIKLRASSSHKRLDEAALKALYDTKQYKSFDKDFLNKEFLDFDLPLEFKLY